MKYITLLCFVTFSLIFTKSFGYSIRGNIHCQQILEKQSSESYRLFIIRWMQGYVTARNYAANVSLRESEYTDVQLGYAVINLCKKKNNLKLHAIAEEIYHLIREKYQE